MFKWLKKLLWKWTEQGAGFYREDCLVADRTPAIASEFATHIQLIPAENGTIIQMMVPSQSKGNGGMFGGPPNGHTTIQYLVKSDENLFDAVKLMLVRRGLGA